MNIENMYYPNDYQEINTLLNTIDQYVNGISVLLCTINQTFDIYTNRVVKAKSLPSFELLHVLRHSSLKAIVATNLSTDIILYLEKLPRAIDTIIIDDLTELYIIEQILSYKHPMVTYPFTKIHYNGQYTTKGVSFQRINSSIIELVLPILDNIEDVINLNPNVKVIGVHGQAYHSNTSRDRNWNSLLNLIKQRNGVVFILFFLTKAKA